MRARDSQRGKVYTTEQLAHTNMIGQGVVFTDVSTIEKYTRRVNEIMGSVFVGDHFPRSTGSVRVVGCGRRGAAAFAGIEIRTGLNDYIMHELWLLHELAHILVQREQRGQPKRDAGHGRRWCAVYLQLVRRFVGTLPYTLLRNQFRAGGVKFNPKRQRAPMTTEQREAAVARLRWARVAMAAKRVATCQTVVRP